MLKTDLSTSMTQNQRHCLLDQQDRFDIAVINHALQKIGKIYLRPVRTHNNFCCTTNDEYNRPLLSSQPENLEVTLATKTSEH